MTKISNNKLTNLKRCKWVPANNLLYREYHDKEWGQPVHEDRKLFEFLILEGAQAGLSWETILKRRQEYVKAFAHFDWNKVAKFDQKKIEDLLQNSGIIRNRLKVESAVINAQKFIEVRKEFGTFDAYLWTFVDGKTINYDPSWKKIPAETEESRALSKDLRKRGFKFVGPTIMYAFMQAVGMVNDHTEDCFLYHGRKEGGGSLRKSSEKCE
jgi:DNA-3-methyladenine glycosylase I